MEVDNVDEGRVRLVFQPYQAVKVTTADCFVAPGDAQLVPNTVLEVLESNWVRSLRSRQERIDETAAFMDRARHFIVPLQDEFAEVVAWDVTWEEVVAVR